MHLMSDITIPDFSGEDVERLIGSIRSAVEGTGCKGVVIGLSGGIDSAVVTKLCADAIGPEKVLNVFMPTLVTPFDDYRATLDLANLFGTEYKVVNVQPAVDALAAVLLTDKETPLENGNIAARCRMIVLYNLAKKRNYIVIGTSNRSELMMGYFTKYGDGGCDVMPMAGLYKTEVRQIAKAIGVPDDIIAKPPSAGLWEGQTDESEMGITYAHLDRILYGIYDLGLKDEEIAGGTGFPVEEVSDIRRRSASMEHKRMAPLSLGRL